jgi:MoaA/NifB/PqqE/SkfB family radical SAM enzyme
VANISLTDKCNLRCEICGSQKSLDNENAKRRNMDIGVFDAVAETLFPFLVTVELNSRGEPLLYPQIEHVFETIRRHDCEVKVQTNGTMFTNRVIDLLVSMSGEVNISMDAVGPKFDEVRANGEWKKVEPALASFLRRRDPKKLAAGFYPTMTRRTIGEAVNIVEWAETHGVDNVIFHSYNPVQDSIEEAPSALELASAKAALAEWIKQADRRIYIRFDGENLNPQNRMDRRTQNASPEKQQLRNAEQRYIEPAYPVYNKLNESNEYICAAPNSYVDISLDGQISACCRTQGTALGSATSTEEFAKAWLGQQYADIRESLKLGATKPFPLKECAECIRFYAPEALTAR